MYETELVLDIAPYIALASHTAHAHGLANNEIRLRLVIHSHASFQPRHSPQFKLCVHVAQLVLT